MRKRYLRIIALVMSDIGNSGTSLGEEAGSGDWQTGKRFAGGASEDEIKAWIDELGL